MRISRCCSVSTPSATAVSPAAGPYQVADWQAGRSITLKPNPKWWGTPPKPSEVVIRFLTPDRQMDALREFYFIDHLVDAYLHVKRDFVPGIHIVPAADVTFVLHEVALSI